MATEPVTPLLLIVGETRYVSMNFGNRFPPGSSLTLSSPTVTGTGLTLSSATVSGYKVRFTVAAAEAGDYEAKVTVTVSGSPAQTLIGIGPVKAVDA